MNSKDIFKILALVLAFFCSYAISTLPCIPQSFGESFGESSEDASVVCVCNSTYCDELDHLGNNYPPPGTFIVVTSSKDGLRFSSSSTPNIIKSDDEFEDDQTALKVTVYRGGKHYQKIIGFGGAFTDATGINLRKHDEPLQQIIIDQYFGQNGLGYNIARVPMGGADFSDHPYTYAPVENDINLDHFALTNEDMDLKIPYIKEAYKRKPDLKLFASVWTAPPWMKTNNDFIGKGSLKEEYYSVWANYFIKFLEEYAKHDLSFWTISTQNEPLHGIFFDMGFNCMGWTAVQQKDWIKNHLGPRLKESPQFSHVKVIMYDDQRLHLQNYTDEILRDPEAAQYISGIGVHWYTDSFVLPDILTTTHYNFPDYFLLGTEACAGAMPNEPDVILGSWKRAVNYASDIISDLNNFVGGWIDWNLLLDQQGGPNWAENFVDAPIISDSSLNLIYKQPIYYALGHFSKFIPEDSVRIRHMKSNTSFTGVEVLSILRPDGLVSIVLLNRLNTMKKITIIDDNGDHVLGFMNVELSPNSISTIIYNRDETNVAPTTNRAAETTYQWQDSLSESTAVQASNTLLFIVLIYSLINLSNEVMFHH